MKKNAGLWIDHKKAVVVLVSDQAEEIKELSSKGEKHHRQQVPADDLREQESKEHLNIYYDEVISLIQDAESILIFGPGEAKGEFEKRLEKHNLTERIAGVETVDKMTDRQIAARVRDYFLKQSPATMSR